MLYLWLKVIHLVFLISWMAGMFYLPRLFVYHANTTDIAGHERFVIMERKLNRGIMMPAMILTLLSGLGMLWATQWAWLTGQGWMHAKLLLVALLVGYHFVCNHYRLAFAAQNNRKTHVFFRFFNEVPVVVLIGIVILVVLKPF